MGDPNLAMDHNMNYSDLTIGFIGFGYMAQNLCKGFLKSEELDLSPNQIVCYDHNEESLLKALKNQTFFGIKKAGSNADLASNVNVIIIAVKPISVNGVLNEIKDFVKESLIISIAAGVETSQLENLLNDGTRVIRVMPNAAAAIQRGATVVSRGSNAVDEDEALTVNLFQSVGYCVKLPESLLNAVTGLSGSGPAYCFMAIDAVGDGGSMLGLPRDIAMKLAAHTMIGAAEMFLQTEKHPMALKDSVCSVGGTTLYGINYLDSNKFRGIIHGVIKAGHDRAVELSELNKP